MEYGDKKWNLVMFLWGYSLPPPPLKSNGHALVRLMLDIIAVISIWVIKQSARIPHGQDFLQHHCH